MTPLEFIASLISSLAWPAASVIIVLVFKKPLLRILGDLKTFKYGKAEIQIGKSFEKLEEAVPDRKSVSALFDPVETPLMAEDVGFSRDHADVLLRQNYDTLVETGPALAVAFAWTVIESEIDAALRRARPDLRHLPPTTDEKISMLRILGWLLSSDLAMVKLSYETSQQVGKLPGNTKKISAMNAETYRTAALEIVTVLRNLN